MAGAPYGCEAIRRDSHPVCRGSARGLIVLAVRGGSRRPLPGELVRVRAVDEADLDEHRDASRDLARECAHDLLCQGGVCDLSERDRLAAAPPGEHGVPGGPDVTGPVGTGQPRHHMTGASACAGLMPWQDVFRRHDASGNVRLGVSSGLSTNVYRVGGRDSAWPVPCGNPVKVCGHRTSLGRMNTLASWAGHLGRALLSEPLPRRWAHVRGVAQRARSLAPVLGADADLLEAVAWLHDIGYAPGLATTGLHALDGARYLRDIQHADAMVCRLAAHHSCASIEAGERGLADVLPWSSSQRRTRFPAC
jgi:putative nucleotidyltransferase with HDIG domain